ncbi:hypothetical protein OR16_12178 [Cupriavidus basilensis OR16]|uniref:Lipoprotein n=1 Tax=Cupriavidus basilensis OR16 TaxID=1127483 RepID=H1S3U2_9BURK|nr:hypothetical protein [Cupriavidus basilensis]EHP42866.1 hypothetical protein OR16_12178 [Cupriavidus basilensis OR16]
MAGKRGLAALLLAASLLALSACGRPGGGAPEGRPLAAAAAGGMAAGELARGGQSEQQEAERRYLALKYALTVENSADALETGWKSVVQRCQALGCELLATVRRRAASCARASRPRPCRIC